jgi:hypothetical protein
MKKVAYIEGDSKTNQNKKFQIRKNWLSRLTGLIIEKGWEEQ